MKWTRHSAGIFVGNPDLNKPNTSLLERANMSFFDKLKSGAEHLGQELAKGIAAGRQELSS